MKALLEQLVQRHGARLIEDHPWLVARWEQQCQRERALGVVGAAGLEDCLFLYLLVKEYRPATIFEIGTFVGATAVVMAEAADLEVVIHTCDKRALYQQSERYEGTIVPHLKTHSARVSRRLRRSGVKADLVFADGRLDWRSARHVADMMNSGSVFATHDYRAGDKGEENLRRMSRRLSARGYRALVPPASWYEGGGCPVQPAEATQPLGINRSIALLLPAATRQPPDAVDPLSADRWG